MQNGYSSDEIERGEDNPGCTVPIWGCPLATVICCILIYGAYRLAIWVGVAASVGF